MKTIMIAAVALLGAAAAVAGPAGAQDRVDAQALMRDLGALASDEMEGRGTGTRGAERARAYIERRFGEIGLEVRRAPFRYQRSGGAEKPGINLWTMIEGSDPQAGVIVVTAHYDHVGIRGGLIHNGADDNASGTAALFAIAQALRAQAPRHDVLLVALDAEELGLHGARAFVAAPPVPLERMMVNINIDMLARGDLGELWASGTQANPALRPVVEAAAGAASIPLRVGQDGPSANGETGEGYEDWSQSSDHAPFAAAGIPHVFFSVENHADYHRPTDDAERVEARFYAGAVAAVLDVLRRLDGDGETLRRAREALPAG